MTLCEVFAREEAMAEPSTLILARIQAIGAAEVARRVAPAWGYELPEYALQRLSRYKARLRDPEGRRGKDMSTLSLFALLDVLGLAIGPAGGPSKKST
jgi:hypothetical protein